MYDLEKVFIIISQLLYRNFVLFFKSLPFQYHNICFIHDNCIAIIFHFAVNNLRIYLVELKQVKVTQILLHIVLRYDRLIKMPTMHNYCENIDDTLEVPFLCSYFELYIINSYTCMYV